MLPEQRPVEVHTAQTAVTVMHAVFRRFFTSFGVIERHRAVLGAGDQISTKFVASTLLNYVEHFF